ncbi:hypothetical protein GJ496_001312 [Pomphorhynchus laevis]|nr:hypothetical protein GJ496_001312 [Pomphorhynchus laevis]
MWTAGIWNNTIAVVVLLICQKCLILCVAAANLSQIYVSDIQQNSSLRLLLGTKLIYINDHPLGSIHYLKSYAFQLSQQAPIPFCMDSTLFSSYIINGSYIKWHQSSESHCIKIIRYGDVSTESNYKQADTAIACIPDLLIVLTGSNCSNDMYCSRQGYRRYCVQSVNHFSRQRNIGCGNSNRKRIFTISFTDDENNLTVDDVDGMNSIDHVNHPHFIRKLTLWADPLILLDSRIIKFVEYKVMLSMWYTLIDRSLIHTAMMNYMIAVFNAFPILQSDAANLQYTLLENFQHTKIKKAAKLLSYSCTVIVATITMVSIQDAGSAISTKL